MTGCIEARNGIHHIDQAKEEGQRHAARRRHHPTTSITSVVGKGDQTGKIERDG
jgi:hypothetical protein